MAEIRKILLKRLFVNSTKYCIRKWHEMSLFSIVNAIFMIVGFKFINGWQDKLFLLWLVPYYMFWYSFFRFYFDRKPYMMTSKIFDTLMPSSRIFGLMLFFTTLLIAIPLIIPFISDNHSWVDKYVFYLQKYTEDPLVLNTITMVIFSIVSPFIFYRPMMGWIASVIGRSGSISTAYARTKGNYWEFLFITVVFNLMYSIMQFCDGYLGTDGWLTILLGSPVIVFMNVILAKTYEYFFLEIDNG